MVKYPCFYIYVQKGKFMILVLQQLSHITVMNSNFGQTGITNYISCHTIGKGAYGEVFKAQDKKTGEFVAIKKVLIPIDSEGLPSTSLRQISLLKEIEHKNVVMLKDVLIENKQLYLVFEYVDRDLKQYLQSLEKDQFLDLQKVKKFLYQILSGIAECHMKRIIHRDLKPANILVDKYDNLKIGDFGLARTYSLPVRPYSQQVVTLWYRAPQILLGSSQYQRPIDIWAIGCIFAEMVAKKVLFQGDSDIDQLYRIFRILGTPDENIWPGVTKLRQYKPTFPNWSDNSIIQKAVGVSLDPCGLDLLKRMLTYDPTARITAKAALNHPYFKDLN